MPKFVFWCKRWMDKELRWSGGTDEWRRSVRMREHLSRKLDGTVTCVHR